MAPTEPARLDMMPRAVLRIVTCLLFLVLIVGSLQRRRPGFFRPFHREIHWLAFAGAAFLLLLLSRSRREVILGVLGTCFLAISLEYLQHRIFLPHDPMEWHDVRDDALGVMLALALYRFGRFQSQPRTGIVSRTARSGHYDL